MSGYLQPPPNSTLGKRRSDDDLGKQRIDEKRGAKAAHYVPNKIRVRKRYYCCDCNEEQGMEKDTTCSTCGHRSWACAECLATRSSDADPSIFITKKHLIFSPPEHTWTLGDLGLNDDTATNHFAASWNFPLFSVPAIEEMKRELFSEEIQQEFQKRGSIVDRQLRGMVPKYARFTHNAWIHPATLAAVSQVAGIELVPVMDLEISHVNVLECSASIDSKLSVEWHQDDYAFVCVLMLSDTSDMTGGHTLLRKGLGGGNLVCAPAKMGSAYVLQGRCVAHAVQAFKGCKQRITAVTSFRPRNPFLQDQTRLCNVVEVSDSSELYSQFCQYRMTIAIERLTLLHGILNGKQVPDWKMNSPSLGQNVEDIRQLLQETCEQLGIKVNSDKMQPTSKANKIDLRKFICTTYILTFAIGLVRAATELRRGVRELRNVGGFDRELVRRIFESVDDILRLPCDK